MGGHTWIGVCLAPESSLLPPDMSHSQPMMVCNAAKIESVVRCSMIKPLINKQTVFTHVVLAHEDRVRCHEEDIARQRVIPEASQEVLELASREMEEVSLGLGSSVGRAW